MKLVQIVYLAILAAFSAASSPSRVRSAVPPSESIECPGPASCISGSPPKCSEGCWPFDSGNECWIGGHHGESEGLMITLRPDEHPISSLPKDQFAQAGHREYFVGLQRVEFQMGNPTIYSKCGVATWEDLLDDFQLLFTGAAEMDSVIGDTNIGGTAWIGDEYK
ncbi:hypothetical protein BDR06DRAFT_976997 [Suillus hirtellus]|nr:hypothetical protein BDR06DRAFT_976997 [Suillus hirtellus]